MNKCRLKYSCRATIVSFLDSSEILRNAELQQRPTAVGHPKSMGPGCLLSWVLVRNSTTRTPLQRFLQQICHIAMPEPNISTCQDVGMWQIFVRWWSICCTTSCRIVVSSSVGGVVQHVRSRCPCSGVWHLRATMNMRKLQLQRLIQAQRQRRFSVPGEHSAESIFLPTTFMFHSWLFVRIAIVNYRAMDTAHYLRRRD